MEKEQTIEKEKIRDYSLDILKAIGIILVLCWHFQPFDITAPRLLDYHIRAIFREGIKAFYLQITLLGVPTFILISMYLYFKRLDERRFQYTKTRLLHLINIFVFWVSVQILVVYIADIPKSIPFSEQMKILLGSLSLWGIFLEGGPRMAFVGGSSVFYYITTLFLLTILATLYWMLAKIPWAGISTGLVIVIGSLIFFEYQSLNGTVFSLLDLRTFAIYIPIAYYLKFSEGKFYKSLLFFLLAGYVAFSVQDYLLRKQELFNNVYLRASIAFGATTLFYAVKHLWHGKISKATSFLSVNSLGIYATHKYFQYISILALTPFFEAQGIGKKTAFGEIQVNLPNLMIAALGFSLTFACVALLGRTPLKKYIR